MRKMIVFVMTIAICISFCIQTFAVTLPQTVRIGLYFGSSALSTVNISSDSNINVYAAGALFAQGTAFRVTASGDVMTLESDSGQAANCENGYSLTFVSDNGILSLGSKRYRGSLELLNRQNGSMTVVNEVGLEEYLYGVVPLELSTGLPIEALKTQAVAARNYAAISIGGYKSQGFDMTNTIASQVYGGVNVEAADCRQAVDETAGKVLTYDGKIAQIFYSASSAGHTLNVKDVWGSDIPYLCGVPDPYQELVKPGNDPWKVTYTKAELKQRLASWGVDIGDVVNLEVTERSPEGAVVKLKFTGTNGEKTYERERARNILNLRSQTFDVLPEGVEQEPVTLSLLSAEGVSSKNIPLQILSVSGVQTMQSSLFLQSSGALHAVTAPTKTAGNADTYLIAGHGNGHGIGMSQNGAIGMAKSGFTYEQILLHYFPGTTLE